MAQDLYATLKTNHGDIEVKLFPIKLEKPTSEDASLLSPDAPLFDSAIASRLEGFPAMLEGYRQCLEVGVGAGDVIGVLDVGQRRAVAVVGLERFALGHQQGVAQAVPELGPAPGYVRPERRSARRPGRLRRGGCRRSCAG